MKIAKRNRTRPYVTFTMATLTNLVVPAVLAVMLVGCNPKSSTSYEPVQKDSSGNVTNSGTKNGSGDPSVSEGPKTVPDVLTKDFGEKPVRGAFGYKDSPSKLADLGAKMDSAFAQTQNGWGQVDMAMQIDGAQLSGKASWKIRDKDEYVIEFYDPKTKAGLNRVISDGKRRVLFFDGKWTELAPPAATSPEIGESGVAVFPATQPRLMLANFERGSKVWGPILRGLDKGVAGFKTIVEERTAKVLGKQRKLYRVLATRASDSASIEIVVDGERYLPVTVRSISKNAKGQQNTILWTCQWLFGDTFPDQEFMIPVKAPGP